MATSDAQRADAAQARLNKATTETQKLAIGKELREATEAQNRSSTGRTGGNLSGKVRVTNPDGTLKS